VCSSDLEVLEVDALDDAAGVHVEAGDDSYGDRHGGSLSRGSRVVPVSPLQQVLAHAEHAAPSCGTVHVVAIDGRSGAGKTSLGREVATAWAATLVSMDSICRGWDGLAAAVPLLVERVLRPLSRGEGAEVPTWDWSLGRPGAIIPLGTPARLVVEGCGASVGEAGRYAGTRVW